MHPPPITSPPPPLPFSLETSLHLPFFPLSLRSANFVRKTFLRSLNQTKMKKAVMKLELHDDRDKKKAMKTVSSMSGVDSIQMDMKDRKLTVVGDIDPVQIVGKLRKLCHTEIVSVGPAKEPEKKKEEPKKEEPKKPEDKKAEEMLQAYYFSHPNYIIAQHQPHYFHRSAVEEDPNACVIC